MLEKVGLAPHDTRRVIGAESSVQTNTDKWRPRLVPRRITIRGAEEKVFSSTPHGGGDFSQLFTRLAGFPRVYSHVCVCVCSLILSLFWDLNQNGTEKGRHAAFVSGPE